jgi:co-chaperonin GroES (HSP10)
VASTTLTVGKNYIETQENAALRILNGFSFSDFEECTVLNNQVVMAIYSEPTTSKGGIIVPEERRKESEYQGKTGLIIAMGPLAYEEDGQWWRGKKPKLGDWIVIRASDGWRLDLYGVQCRQFDDTLTRLIVPHPEAVW